MDSGCGGWYNSRKQYRSVAFGTWKPGAAHKVFQKSNTNLEKIDSNEAEQIFEDRYIVGSGYNTISVTPRSRKKPAGDLHCEDDALSNLGVKIRKMGESSPNISRINHENDAHIYPLPRLLDSSLSTDAMNRVNPPQNQDLYSSTEYVAYLGRKASEDGRIHLDALNGNSLTATCSSIRDGTRTIGRHLDRQSRNRLETSVHRVHYRSHSAGADAVFSVNSPLDMRSPLSFGRSDSTNPQNNQKFLRATKKFFKKIYSNATLPKKPPVSTSTDNFQVSQPFFDMSYREPPRLEESSDDAYNSYSTYSSVYHNSVDEYRNQLVGMSYPKYSDIQYPDSGMDDRSSTPDHSVESMTLTSTSKSESTSSDSPSAITDNGNWNDVFAHLKREIFLMRERDQQILSDLHKVESQLKSVRLQQMMDDFNNIPNMDDLEPGQLVQSMPL